MIICNGEVKTRLDGRMILWLKWIFGPEKDH